jgi:DNA-binding transcriptional ArsR family regulator
MPVHTDELSLVFAALADPTRRDILTQLREGGVTSGDLAAKYSISRSAVSQHLNVLDRAGLIVRSVNKQWRECRVRDAGLDDAAGWVEAHRAVWVDQLDQLEQHLLRQKKDRA